MSWRRLSLGIAVLLLGSTLASTPAARAWTRSPQRIAGPDRYQTAVDISKAAFPDGAPTAVVVSGVDFPDGLAAGPLAALRKSPVLLTAPDALPINVAVELQRLGAKTVTIVGGTAAVQDHVVEQITEVTSSPATRVAGATRYDTATAVSAFFPASGPAVYVASGADFPDALAAGAAAAVAGVPLLLTPPDTVPPVALDALKRLQPAQARVAGGTKAVSDAAFVQIYSVVADVRRLSGNDRYATAAAIGLDEGLHPAEVLMATGATFPDALAAAPLAAVRSAPVFLATSPCAPDPTVVAMSKTSWPNVTIIGGTTAVSSAAGQIVPCSPVPDHQINPGVGVNTQVLPGPVVAHVLTIDRSQGVDVRVISATGRLRGFLPTTGMARRTGAIAAVNGDFSDANAEPDHAFAVAGRLLKWPGDVNTLVGFDPAKPGYGFFGAPQPTVVVDLPGAPAPLSLADVNGGMPTGESMALYTPEYNVTLPDGNWCRASLRNNGSPAINGNSETVQSYLVDTAGCSTDPIARDKDVLVAPGDSALGAALGKFKSGASVTMRWRMHTTDQGVTDVIGANLTLVFGGQVASDVTDNSGSFFNERAARTAVAQRPDGIILLVVVDKSPKWSVGMTPRELADYLVALGAIDAANLDGGGSSTMAVEGLLVNRPEDGFERATASAIVVVPKGVDPSQAPPGT